ncbi:MAG TPA: metal-dependent hydrolase [Terriglobales bacterium]|nr:metal-dependent hydrolase [Terriglobales bacterium]
MEPITHLLTGACMSRAGLNRKTGLATATLVLAAEASDIDVFYAFRGPVSALQHHRGWTHSFVGVPVMAALTLLVVWAWHRLFRKWRLDPETPEVRRRRLLPVRWGVLYGIALLGPLSHILLDYTTAYGIRMFEPLSYKWYEWDTVSIIEPFMLGVLILGLTLPSLFGLIHEEIGARQPRFRGRVGAIVALAAVVLMWGVRDFYHRRAVSALEARIYQSQDPLRVSAFPYPWNPFVWHGVVETRDFYQTLPVDSLRGEVDPQDRARTYYKPEETPVLEAAKKSYLGRVYLDWAKYPLTLTEALEERDVAYRVRFLDLRYTYPGRQTPLRASVDLSKSLQVVAQRFGRRLQK